MFRFLSCYRFLPTLATTFPAAQGNLLLTRLFSSRPRIAEKQNSFIHVPEDKVNIEVRQYKPVGDNVSNKSISSRVYISFNVDEAEWMPDKVKDVFKQQEASRIDDHGNFTIISSLHRSIVGNRVEAMRKLQTKVNQACISTMDRHTIGNVISPLAKEKRLKEKHMRSELSHKRRSVNMDFNDDDLF